MRILPPLGILTILLCSFTAKAQQQTVGTFVNSANALDGYTTVFPFNNSTIYLIDNCGLKVHEWQTSTPTLIAYIQPNGDLIKAGIDVNARFGNPGYHGILQRYDWQGALKWQYSMSSDSLVLHHDIEVMPNGNILAIGWHKISPEDLKALGRDSMHPSTQDYIWEEVIYEIKPVGNSQAQIVWEWHVIDHIIQDYDSTKANYGVVSEHPELLNINFAIDGVGTSADWLHFNSIDFNQNLNQILISGLTFNEIYIIDHSAGDPSGHIGGTHGKGGDIIYRWGNPMAYEKGGPQDKKSFGQHDPNWIKYGPHADKIIYFNNGGPRGYSSVEILNPPIKNMEYELDPNGVYGPGAADYIFTKTPNNQFFSAVMSGAEVLPNGNLFMVEATKGKFTEYNVQSGTVVWEYINPITVNSVTKQGTYPAGNNTFRAYKYPKSYSAFSGKTLSPGLPLEVDPWPSDCNGIDTTTQDTTQDSTAAIHKLTFRNQGSLLKLYPNPTHGTLYLSSSDKLEAVRIRDIHGRVVMELPETENDQNKEIKLEGLMNGVYHLHFMRNGSAFSERFILLNM